jgi:hypothetical protein
LAVGPALARLVLREACHDEMEIRAVDLASLRNPNRRTCQQR